MLEPRRIAARAVAGRMAHLLGQSVGQTVGFRTRLETRVGRETRIEVVTEGILTRMLQEDSSLAGIGCVIFDEFHERSLNADLGLALSIECQENLREELRLVVMSATLDLGPIAARFCRGCRRWWRRAGAALRSLRNTWRVGRRYTSSSKPRRESARPCASTTATFCVSYPARRRFVACSAPWKSRASIAISAVLPLFGDLTAADRDAALTPAPAGHLRKSSWPTSIAETSLTIEVHPGGR